MRETARSSQVGERQRHEAKLGGSGKSFQKLV